MSSSNRSRRRPTVSLVNLGCPKNQLDGDVILGLLAEAGWRLVSEEKRSDVLIVNTCSFIRDAVGEAIDVILAAAERKKRGECRRLVVTGCLPARYGADLTGELPEVDLFLSSAEIGEVAERVAALIKGDRAGVVRPGTGRQEPPLSPRVGASFLYGAQTPIVRSTPRHSAYVKIAEGCARRCSYCTVPAIRGPQRSRPVEDVREEVEMLGRLGTVEVCLIAQDLTSYGRDLPGKPRLSDLLRSLLEVEPIRWFRLLYTYPGSVGADLVEMLAAEERLCRYLDVPIQHVNERILKSMRRGSGARGVRETIARLEKGVPGITLRTSVIVGWPGETRAEFRELLDYVQEGHFRWLGAFRFSPEEGTPAAELPGVLTEKVIESRWHEVMGAQQEVTRRLGEGCVGERIEVLVEGPDDREGYPLVGRARDMAPEVDGVVHLKGSARAGTAVAARVTAALEYDLLAEIEDGGAGAAQRGAGGKRVGRGGRV